MLTYWLVALLIGLLIFDFSSYIRSGTPLPSRSPWTIPDSLLVLSIAMAVFCIGLAWRYHIGTLDKEISVLNSWLPYVLLLLGLCIISGFVESWRGSSKSNPPIEDPYHLLETALPLSEPPLFETKKQKMLVLRATMLACSVLIGFSGAAFLLQFNSSNPEATFFPSDRVRPTQVPAQPSPHALTLFEPVVTDSDIPALALINNEKPAAQMPLAAELSVSEEVAATPPPAIGGPIRETSLESLTVTTKTTNDSTSSAAYAAYAADETSETNDTIQGTSPYYSVVIQAILGAKARNQPTTEGSIVDVLDYGSKQRAIGRTSNGEWIQLKIEEDLSAWIITDAIDGLLFNEQQLIVTLDELPAIDNQ